MVGDSENDTAQYSATLESIPEEKTCSKAQAATPSIQPRPADNPPAADTMNSFTPPDRNPDTFTPAVWNTERTNTGHTFYSHVETKVTRWGRPDELGGPIVYKEGDEVEVWSNGYHAWGKGTVHQIDGDTGRPICKFLLPNGKEATKMVLEDKDVQPLNDGMQTELWSPEEATFYRSLFVKGQADANAKTKTNADVAAMLQGSGLNQNARNCVWSIGNPRQLTALEFDDFACICRLVAHCQALGRDSEIVAAGERAFKQELRSRLFRRPQQLPTFR